MFYSIDELNWGRYFEQVKRTPLSIELCIKLQLRITIKNVVKQTFCIINIFISIYLYTITRIYYFFNCIKISINEIINCFIYKT